MSIGCAPTFAQHTFPRRLGSRHAAASAAGGGRRLYAVRRSRRLRVGLAACAGCRARPSGVGSLMFSRAAGPATSSVTTRARRPGPARLPSTCSGRRSRWARLLPAALRAQAQHRWAQEELETRARHPEGAAHGHRRPRPPSVSRVAKHRGAVRVFGCPRSAAARRRPRASARLARRPASRRSGRPIAWTILLAQSDVVVIAAPHTPETKRLIGRAQIDRMKSGRAAGQTSARAENWWMTTR